MQSQLTLLKLNKVNGNDADFNMPILIGYQLNPTTDITSETSYERFRCHELNFQIFLNFK